MAPTKYLVVDPVFLDHRRVMRENLACMAPPNHLVVNPVFPCPSSHHRAMSENLRLRSQLEGSSEGDYEGYEQLGYTRQGHE